MSDTIEKKRGNYIIFLFKKNGEYIGMFKDGGHVLKYFEKVKGLKVETRSQKIHYTFKIINLNRFNSPPVEINGEHYLPIMVKLNHQPMNKGLLPKARKRFRKICSFYFPFEG